MNYVNANFQPYKKAAATWCTFSVNRTDGTILRSAESKAQRVYIFSHWNVTSRHPMPGMDSHWHTFLKISMKKVWLLRCVWLIQREASPFNIQMHPKLENWIHYRTWSFTVQFILSAWANHQSIGLAVPSGKKASLGKYLFLGISAVILMSYYCWSVILTMGCTLIAQAVFRTFEMDFR